MPFRQKDPELQSGLNNLKFSVMQQYLLSALNLVMGFGSLSLYREFNSKLALLIAIICILLSLWFACKGEKEADQALEKYQ